MIDSYILNLEEINEEEEKNNIKNIITESKYETEENLINHFHENLISAIKCTSTMRQKINSNIFNFLSDYSININENRGWEIFTSGTYKEIIGIGHHNHMLSGENVIENSKLITQILTRH